MRPNSKIFAFTLFAALCFSNLALSQFYFGRNKINYEHFSWSILESEHFNIYFYQEEEHIAAMAQEIAEEAFDEFEIKFNLTIDRAIPLIVYSNPIHFQQTNVIPALLPEGVGGFFEFRKGRVVLPFNGSRRDFYHVVRHELVHVFTHLKIASTARRVGLIRGVDFPLWFFEGLAEYWSIGYDSQADMFIRDAILHDYLLPLDSSELYFSGFLLYKEGQAFFKYYEEKFGQERIRRLMTNFWRYDSFEKTITAVSGKSFRVIMREWEYYLKKKYAHYMAQEDISNYENRKLLQRDVEVSPAIFKTDSSKRIIYMSNRWGYENIIVRQLSSGKRRILIKANRTPEYESLHILQSRISVNQYGELAFVAKSEGRDVIWIQDIENEFPKKNIASSSLISIRSPMWNQSGDMLVFAAQRSSGQSDIYLWSKKEDQIYQLTDDIYGDASPSFSPDSRYIVFSSDRGSEDYFVNDNLYVYDLQTGALLQLTFSPGNEFKPFWHPSNINIIYFLSDSTGSDNLWALELDDSGLGEGSPIGFAQLSNYFTGINDFHPDSDSSLVLSHFSRYNFHLDLFAIDSTRFKKVDKISAILPDATQKTFRKNKPGKARAYKLKYSLDFAQSFVAYDPIFGRLGGAQLGISDMLGDRYYNFLLGNTSVTASGFKNYWNFAASMVDLRRRSNRSLGVFHFANDWYSPYEGYFYERNVGIRGALNYPINAFKRIEFSSSMWHSRREYFDAINNRFLLANFISFVHDNSLWLSTGPIDGWRMRLSVGPSFDLLSSQVNNYTLLGDFRYYLRLSERTCLATRVMGIVNEGKNIYRYYIGGSWYLRGYRRTEIFGKKFLLWNTELRFPIARGLVLQFRRGAIGLAPLRGSLFVDIGNAWDRAFPGMIGSFGIGLRAPLMQAVVLRLDIGKRTDFNKIEPETFVQFLFGWNY